jgi:hypothetical protein
MIPIMVTVCVTSFPGPLFCVASGFVVYVFEDEYFHLKGFNGFRPFKGSRVQGFQYSRVPGFKGSRVQEFKSFRVSEFQGFRPARLT